MKPTGIVRQMDSLGRVVLPIELRRTLDIKNKDFLEILADGNSIILRKHDPNCCFCGSSRDLTAYKDKLVCDRCLKELKAL